MAKRATTPAVASEQLKAPDLSNDGILPRLTGVLEQMTQSLRSVKDMPFDELLKQYDPVSIDGQTSPITSELISRVQRTLNRNPSVVVFNSELKVDVEQTQKLLTDALQGFPDSVTIKGGKRGIAFTFPFGAAPGRIYSINPLTNERLRESGVDGNGFDWSPVPQNVRQLLYLARRTAEIPADSSPLERSMLLGLASGPEGFTQIQGMFPRAAAEFVRRAEVNSLPSLKRRADRTGDDRFRGDVFE